MGVLFFHSLDWGLTPVRATISYWNEGLVAVSISPCAVDRGRISAIGVCENMLSLVSQALIRVPFRDH